MRTIEEIVEIELNELIDLNFEGLMDLVEEKIDKGILSDIHYQLIGVNDSRVQLKIIADVETL